MNQTDLKDDKYIRLLDELIRKLKEEIDLQTAESCGSFQSLEQLDRYLQEVNSYYYQTFHQSFFPEYRRSLQEDLNRSQILGGQEELLIQHIAATLKRYAGLYNQIKINSQKLQLLHDQAARELQFLNNRQNRMVLELMYGMKSLFETMQALVHLSDALVQLSLPELNVSQMESFGPALHSLCSKNRRTESLIPILSKILKNFHYIKNLLQQLQYPGPGLAEQDMLREMHRALESSSTYCQDTEWGGSYLQQLGGRLSDYLELLALNIETGKSVRVQHLNQEFQKQLSDWMLFFEQIITRLSSPYFYLLPEIYEMEAVSPGYVQELQHDIESHRKSIEVIIQQFNAAAEPEFEYFDQEIKKMLEFTAPFFSSICSEAVPYPTLLDQHLHRVNLCLQSLTLQREALEEENCHVQNICSHIEQFLTGITGQMQLWNNILHDLERLFAPRNISRLWKGITVKLTQIPLHDGQPIPHEYEYLIDRHHISTRLSDKEDYTVLHQEGDLFIIQVEQLTVEEIPYLIVSRKG